MAQPVSIEVLARDGAARRGRLITAHGVVETPAFMPVGTRAAVKAMAPGELWDIGYRMILANAYHLAVRPGPDLIHVVPLSCDSCDWRAAPESFCETCEVRFDAVIFLGSAFRDPEAGENLIENE